MHLTFNIKDIYFNGTFCLVRQWHKCHIRHNPCEINIMSLQKLFSWNCRNNREEWALYQVHRHFMGLQKVYLYTFPSCGMGMERSICQPMRKGKCSVTTVLNVLLLDCTQGTLGTPVWNSVIMAINANVEQETSKACFSQQRPVSTGDIGHSVPQKYGKGRVSLGNKLIVKMCKNYQLQNVLTVLTVE